MNGQKALVPPPCERNLKDKKGLSNCSGLFYPSIYLYQHCTVNEKLISFDDEKGLFALGKIVQVPNHRKFVDISPY